ncbi:MAG: glutamate--tRNA ligase, partial [Acetobacteraceae bacterium]|nr:glutamate--tRNA ligase [Acetobacteraceae bacterium]
YLSPAELAAMRDAATAEGRSLKVNSPRRDRDPRDAPADIAPVIRLKAPRLGDTIVGDLVQGDVRVANAELDDLIILRADGTPTYLHAVVVDDHDMAITHVIRGDDHLTNTFRQIQIYQANGWALPQFAHIPLIHGPDGAKLSKRHGAQSVTEFRDLGYVPDGVCNYLLRLGWAHGDDEILSRDEAIAVFDLDGVGRGPSRMDYVKLGQVNAVWMRRTDEAWLVADVERRLGVAAPGLAVLLPMLKERAKTLVELTEAARFLTTRLAPDGKALAALTADGRALLAALAPDLAACDFSISGIDAVLRAFAEAHGKKLGDIAQPLRAALTGRLASPPIDATIAALGRDEVLGRLAELARV